MTGNRAEPPRSGVFEVGDVLASRYRIGQKLGEGGMGIVYAGAHLDLEARVAVKVLQPSLAQDLTARARFLREARLAASIEGEHSTRIHDVGVDDRCGPYMVMEHLSGELVSARLSREGKLSVVDATTVVLQVLAVLAEAHSKGLVHRDLKPANLFLVDKPGEAVWVKVLDFGISKLADSKESEARGSTTLTGPRMMLGSPEYMSPEQMRDSARVDSRSDLWACGVILFELLSGKLPFEASSLPDLCARIVADPPRPLASVDSVPPAVARTLERCLRKDPAQRPQTAYEVAVGLAPYGSESARALLPRIRAWCKVDAALPNSVEARSRRVLLGGSTLVAAAGVLAFAAASVTSASSPMAASSGSPREVTPLQPLSSGSPLPPADPSPPPPPASNAAAASGSPTSVTSSLPRAPPRLASPRETPRAKSAHAPPSDLDEIDLLQ